MSGLTGGCGIEFLNYIIWQQISLQMKEFDLLFAADTREKMAECQFRNQCWKCAAKARLN